MKRWHGSLQLFWALLAITLILCGKTAQTEPTDINATRLQAQNGDADAQYTLAGIYANGQGADKDLKRSTFWYLRAAMGDHIEAQYQLGMIYETGLGIAQDYTQALTWYGKAAHQGHRDAQSHRERILNHIDSLKRAAHSGDATAQCALGDMYGKGNGVFQDDEQAAEWYRKSAEQGYAEAEYHLSSMFFKGKGVAHDPVSAYAWLSLAADQGHEIAETNKAFAKSTLSPSQLIQSQALAKKIQDTISKK